jgi:hypothetical protein
MVFACSTPAPPLRTGVPPLAGVAADTAGMPPSCRAHGGVVPYAPALPQLTKGRRREPRLDTLDFGQLWIRLYAVRTHQPTDGGFWLEPRGRVGGIERVDATWIRLEERAGTYQLLIRSIGSTDWRDTIHIRRGSVDSLAIGLGNSWLCSL